MTVAKSVLSNLKIVILSYIAEIKNYTDCLDKNISGLLLSKVDVFGESAEGGETVFSCHLMRIAMMFLTLTDDNPTFLDSK